jgi:glyoxalase family protein
MQPVQGLHHITAVASDSQTNVDFYRNVLGQRLVKTTVNFDDPHTYHLYYGDEVGTPGTIMTFFPWLGMQRGMRGSGETAAVAYSVPPGSLGFWDVQLAVEDLHPEPLEERFGASGIGFDDPDGMRIELIEDDRPLTIRHWEEGPIPEAYALRGFHSVTLWLHEIEPTAALLTEQMGYTLVGQEPSAEGDRFRYEGASGDVGLYVDLVHRPSMPQGRFGSGSVHHIAFRTVDDEEQDEYRTKLLSAGYPVTTVQDRQYFHSIYFRSPGGVLFEIATDAPGFYYDEPIAELGESLKLPSWLEGQRASIERGLPSFKRRAIRKATAMTEGSNNG